MPAITLHKKSSFTADISHLSRQSSTLSFSRSNLQKIAEENSDISKRGKYPNSRGEMVVISDALSYSVKNSKHYHYTDQVQVPKLDIIHNTHIYVCYGLCVKAALKLRKHGGRHVGVLNSAHATTPGAKFLSGCLSLESCICRATLLWPCLAQFDAMKSTIYKVNRSEKFHLSPSACAIYSPNVPIIRKDSLEAIPLDDFEQTSIVSIPPPNAFELADDKVIKDSLREHLFRALCIFAENKCEDLVLCSYGCGTRGNDPEMVAEIFNDLLSNEFKSYFHTIVFAINPRKETEYEAFTAVFEK